MTFTPLIAGYWAVSVSCGVTVTDIEISPCWTGIAKAGPKDVTSYTLDITYTGPVAGGTSDSGTVVTNQTTNVHAGWPIQLGAKIAPSDLETQFTWMISGADGNGNGDAVVPSKPALFPCSDPTQSGLYVDPNP